MFAYTAPALVILAEAYMKGVGMRATSLGLKVCANDKLFTGLLAGGDCLTGSARLQQYVTE